MHVFPLSFSRAAQEVVSFDSPAALEQWRVRLNPLERSGLELSPKFVTTSANSLLLKAPRWEHGLPEWPLWTVEKSFEPDWSPYDRLVIDMVNPTDAVELVTVKTLDSETAGMPSSNWPGTKVAVMPRSHLRAVLPLDLLMKGIHKSRMDQSDVSLLMLGATRPNWDFHLHISGISLLKPGEKMAPLPEDYLGQLVELALTPAREECEKAIQASAQALGAMQSGEAVNQALGRLDGIRKRFADLSGKVDSPEFRSEDIAQSVLDFETISREALRLPSLAALSALAREEGRDYAVAWVSSMQKVLPREMPIPFEKPGATERLSLAKNETESIQLLVVPFEQELKNVRVEAGEFVDAEGDSLPPEAVSVRTVGFVKTEPVGGYDVDYTGWWPDPLLDFLPSVSIPPEEAQTFWISFRVPKDQKAGVYKGVVTVTSEDAPAVSRELEVEVYDFALSGKPPIEVSLPTGTRQYFEQFSREPWDQLKLRVADFLADHYITWDNLYEQRPPDWDVLERLKSQGRLGTFNLYPLGFSRAQVGRTNEEDMDAQLEDLIEKIKPVYAEAKRRGLLEHAYFYGMDELASSMFAPLVKISDAVKTAFPDVPIATTAQDMSYGEDSGANNVDIWIPVLHDYDFEAAEQARQRGKSIWWYNFKTPAHPYPNQFTEYPAIDLRVLHGAITAKYQPDGFLYYSLFRSWQPPGRPPRRTIEKGPFTDWDPCALAFSEYDRYNGEGYLAYPGPNGHPLASIRLENFRDGFEDLSYWHKLKEQVEELGESENLSELQKQWLADAKVALEIPEDLVRKASDYSSDPKRLRAWRSRLAEAIAGFPHPSSPQNP